MMSVAFVAYGLDFELKLDALRRRTNYRTMPSATDKTSTYLGVNSYQYHVEVCLQSVILKLHEEYGAMMLVVMFRPLQ